MRLVVRLVESNSSNHNSLAFHNINPVSNISAQHWHLCAVSEGEKPCHCINRITFRSVTLTMSIIDSMLLFWYITKPNPWGCTVPCLFEKNECVERWEVRQAAGPMDALDSACWLRRGNTLFIRSSSCRSPRSEMPNSRRFHTGYTRTRAHTHTHTQ